MPTGTVKSWNEGRGFGFIDAEDGESLFCHFSGLSGCEGLREGDTVEFEKQYDEKKQKFNAVNVTGGTGSLAPSPAAGAGGEEGKVSKWNEERGFGFIADTTGAEIFVHRFGIQNADFLTIGEKVTFSREIDDKKEDGKAKKVTFSREIDDKKEDGKA
eukprot:CAMPEP_0204310938 /NCGR_PEP_ID=MMETSP0469-20131031/2033_1 /ASSEMBLY_ACC=CAM_ASM_000384 /TAXON_ID=2969 /ORGANISM="Oxyrrhis marina" /LENGTH=157 /DNA_ID=CAMNT_0051290799 /DNA_START=38 /DNA_END=508 /DNA_ORIENTATION=+